MAHAACGVSHERNCFANDRTLKHLTAVSTVAARTLAAVLFLVFWLVCPASAQTGPEVSTDTHHDLSPPLRDMKVLPGLQLRHERPHRHIPRELHANAVDPVVQ